MGRRALGSESSMRRRRPGVRGAVAVEFLIAIVPFTLIFTGVIQLALISVAKLTVHYAAAGAAQPAAAASAAACTTLPRGTVE